jgi:hypothetical protein
MHHRREKKAAMRSLSLPPVAKLNINSSGLIWSVSMVRIFSRLWMHGLGLCTEVSESKHDPCIMGCMMWLRRQIDHTERQFHLAKHLVAAQIKVLYAVCPINQASRDL